MPDDSLFERAAQQLADDLTTLPEAVAPSMGQPQGTVKASPDEERRMYWQRNTDVNEAALWSDTVAEGMREGLSYEAAVERATPRIAMTVYPARAVLIRDGERRLSVKKQKAYSDRMAKMGPPSLEDGDTDGP